MPDSEKPLNHVSIIGCGDIGCRVAVCLLKTMHFTKQQITGYTRSKPSLDSICSIGIGAKAYDLDTFSLNQITNTTASQNNFHNQLVFYFAPPPLTGSTDSRLRGWLAALDVNHLPKRILYISTTGVYGDHQGALVTEKTPTQPQTDRAKRRLDAEKALRQFSREHTIDFVILRVPGIYGKNRLPVERLKKQLPILLPNIAPITNRIHEDDLAQICVTAALQSDSGEVYNVADGDCLTISDYFIQIATHLALPIPPMINWQEAQATLSSGMLSYLAESRLIDNKKLLNKLNIVLKFPCLRDYLIYTKTQ